MINVTKTYLPDIEKYKQYVNEIFSNAWLTNFGEFHQELEKKLSDFLDVEFVVPVVNGTLALQVACKLLGLTSEVITTPFSFVATVSSLVWEGLNTKFADIDPYTLNINPQKIEENVTNKTSAIVPVHVFGNACIIEEIQDIAFKHKLKIIYDAAHTFGVKYKGKSLCSYGDISILSFHSTKLFHTIEGGALILKDKVLYDRARLMINFGIPGYDQVSELGINAKMNEFQAAMGLCVLEDIKENIRKRKKIYNRYLSGLNITDKLQFQQLNQDMIYNYSYFPVIFQDEKTLLQIRNALDKINVNCRRYFYPSLDKLPYIHSTSFVPVSNSISSRILCLPLYETLDENKQEEIISKIISLL